jgi:Domain of unknown function (DUF4105)
LRQAGPDPEGNPFLIYPSSQGSRREYRTITPSGRCGPTESSASGGFRTRSYKAYSNTVLYVRILFMNLFSAHFSPTKKTIWSALLIVPALIAVIVYLCIQPSHQREWVPEQATMPRIEFHDQHVLIHDIRNSHYRSSNDFDLAYYSKLFDLNHIESVWFIVEPFSSWKGLAHTFISFGFKDNTYVAFSIEVRKEKDETYSPIKGLFKQYELIYVIGDERDLIKLRSNFRKNEVFVYPIRTSQDKIRSMFVNMLKRVNQLNEQPEFYHTLTNNCTSNLVEHVNDIAPGRIPFSFNSVLPGYSDQLAYTLKLINTNLPLEAIRPHFKINDRAEQYGEEDNFSEMIRQFPKTHSEQTKE